MESGNSSAVSRPGYCENLQIGLDQYLSLASDADWAQFSIVIESIGYAMQSDGDESLYPIARKITSLVRIVNKLQAYEDTYGTSSDLDWRTIISNDLLSLDTDLREVQLSCK
jgi:hypothetical protein